jgi:putative ubiquitin-RnfH superfamily antitoxin RatB of RatAB toxin-antitoxin module
MGNGEKIRVEVAYARPDTQWLIPLEVALGTQLEQAIRLSGILEKCPEIDLSTNKVGIFGKLSTLERRLQQGDRVEIYRPLVADPKQARKRRALNEKQRKP